MTSLKLFLSFVLLGLPSVTQARPQKDLETIKKDVLVIGAGAAGTYGAVRLFDANKTVAVVEASGRLGGHAEAYYSSTGGVTNVAVQIFYVSLHFWSNQCHGLMDAFFAQDIPVVADYFERLGVPLLTQPVLSSGTEDLNFDFALNVAIPTTNVTTDQQLALAAAIQRYSEYLAANFSTVYPGYYLPDPVPEDFLMPFGEFMRKYNMDAIVNLISRYIQPAEAWRETALFPLKLLSLDPVRGITSGFKVTPDVTALYRSAASILGDSVLYNSTVASLRRTNGTSGCIEAIVNTPEGLKRIIASKVLMTAPPVAESLVGWDTTAAEEALFAKFKVQEYHAGVIRNTALPVNRTIQNVGIQTPYNIPELPALFNIVPTGLGDNTAVAYYTAREPVGLETAQAGTLAAIDQLVAAGLIADAETEIVEWYDHRNVRMYVDAEDIRDGFYSDLYALQGQLNTYWSGAAWVTQASSPIWDYTKTVVDTILAS